MKVWGHFHRKTQSKSFATLKVSGKATGSPGFLGKQKLTNRNTQRTIQSAHVNLLDPNAELQKSA